MVDIMDCIMKDWWYCDNIVAPEHEGQLGLLHMGEPRVFILIRSYADSSFATFEEFSENIAEVNFLDWRYRERADIDSILRDAWNFMAAQEEKEENMYKNNYE